MQFGRNPSALSYFFKEKGIVKNLATNKYFLKKIYENKTFFLIRISRQIFKNVSIFLFNNEKFSVSLLNAKARHIQKILLGDLLICLFHLSIDAFNFLLLATVVLWRYSPSLSRYHVQVFNSKHRFGKHFLTFFLYSKMEKTKKSSIKFGTICDYFLAFYV